jgi:hypothetical protein
MSGWRHAEMMGPETQWAAWGALTRDGGTPTN